MKRLTCSVCWTEGRQKTSVPTKADRIHAIQSLGKPLCLYAPLPAAAGFHASNKKFRWYFGGNRSGKSEANIGFDLCTYALGCHPYRRTPPNAVIWAATDTWDMVGKVLWQEKISQYLPQHHIRHISWHNKGANIPKEIRLNNGNAIELKAFQQGRELFQGRPIDAFYGDEQCRRDAEAIWQEVQARLIDRQGFTSWSCTPIIPQSWLEQRVEDEKPTDDVFYANLNDNRKSKGGYLPDVEIDALIAEWPEEVQETRINGHFASFYGAVYKVFDRKRHVIEPFDIPADWQRWRSIDWGFNNPFVCLWLARNPDNQWFVYREHYKAQDSLANHAEKILRVSSGEKFVKTYADHDAQDRYEFRNLGIRTYNAKKDVHNGIEAVQTVLKLQGNNQPRLFIFNNCKNTIREMGSYRYPEGTDTKDPKDEPEKKDDHTCDALRYVIYSVERKRSAGIYISGAS